MAGVVVTWAFGIFLAGSVVYLLASSRLASGGAGAGAAEHDALLRQLRDFLFAGQGVLEELESVARFDPELRALLAAVERGDREEALRRAGTMALSEPDQSTLAMAHVHAASGDRAGAAEVLWRSLAAVEGCSHQALQTWHRLRELGVEPPAGRAQDVLGLVVDIGFGPEGTDTVAAYADGSSRFISRAGGALIEDDYRPEVEAAARRAVSVAAAFVATADRDLAPRAPPRPGTVQFTFLTPSGPLVRTSTKAELWDDDGELAPLFEPVAELIALKVGKG